tara:strand:- start:1418 stop:1588 length:171 start_codon:yes stop_codon:yes gene_type:complete
MDYVKSNKIKDRVNELGKNYSPEATDKLNEKIEDILNKAIYRADKNERKTVMSRDI